MAKSDMKWQLTEGAAGDQYAFIQWKGTDVCMEFDCAVCKANNPNLYGPYGLHYDGYFAHALQCGDCGTVYEVAAHVAMRQIPEGDEPYHTPRVVYHDGDWATKRG